MDQDKQIFEFSDGKKHIFITNYAKDRVSQNKMRGLRDLFYERCGKYELPFKGVMKIIDFENFPGRVYCYYCLQIDGIANQFILPAHANNPFSLAMGFIYFIEDILEKLLRGGSLDEIVSLHEMNMAKSDYELPQDTLPQHFNIDELLKRSRDDKKEGDEFKTP